MEALTRLSSAVVSLMKALAGDQTKPELSATMKSAIAKLKSVVEPDSEVTANSAVTKMKEVRENLLSEIGSQTGGPVARVADLLLRFDAVVKKIGSSYLPNDKPRINSAFNLLARAVKILGGEKVTMAKPTQDNSQMASAVVEGATV